MARWEIFKTTMGVDGETASMWFFNCLDKDLGDEVLKANPGTPPQNRTEQNLIACTKKLAVKVESKLIHRIFSCSGCHHPWSRLERGLQQEDDPVCRGL